MRIIAGIARGASLRTLPGKQTRPTLDRVRESIFSSLGDLRGQVVADLFAGTGSLGLEALSRGAAQALFVENNRQCLRVLRRNIEWVSRFFVAAGQPLPQIEVVAADVLQVAGRRSGAGGWADVVFADPPYSSSAGGTGAAELLASPDFALWLGRGLLVLERPAGQPSGSLAAGGWRLLKVRRFGHCEISFMRRAEAGDEPGPGSG